MYTFRQINLAQCINTCYPILAQCINTCYTILAQCINTCCIILAQCTDTGYTILAQCIDTCYTILAHCINLILCQYVKWTNTDTRRNISDSALLRSDRPLQPYNPATTHVIHVLDC